MRRVLAAATVLAVVGSGCGQQRGVHVSAPNGEHVVAEGVEVRSPGDTSSPGPEAPPTAGEADEPGEPPQARPRPEPDRTEHPHGLVPFELFARQTTSPPPVQALLELDRCPDASELGAWAVDALAPFGDVSGEVVVEPLAEIATTTPVLRDSTVPPACAVAGRLDHAQVWELRADDGRVLGRGVASERLADTFPRVYERQERLGGINFGYASTASGQSVAGVWRGDRMELDLSEIEPRRHALLIVEWPAERTQTDDEQGQRLAEARAGRLTTATLDLPEYLWPPPVPQALPPGFVRCAGPYPNGGFHASTTELCHPDGRTIHIATVNEGVNPVPDPPTTTEVTERGDRLVLEIDTPVEDATVTVPASFGHDRLEAMAATIPLLDRRFWFPASGRGDELIAGYDGDWWADTLAAAGASDIDVDEAPIACPAVAGGEPCPSPGQLPPYEGTATAPDGSRVEFHITVYQGPPPDHQAPRTATRVFTVGDTDAFVTDGYGPGVATTCGGVSMSLRPEGVGTTNRTHWDVEPSVDLMARVLEVLGC